MTSFGSTVSFQGEGDRGRGITPGAGKWKLLASGRKEVMRVIEREKEHYEVQEVPYGKVYCWRPEHVRFECDCGETLDWAGGSVRCRCGARYEEFGLERVDPEQEKEAYQPWIEDYEAWRKVKNASGVQHEYYAFVREENGG